MIISNSFHIVTYGCTFNQSDSDKISKILIELDMKLVEKRDAEYIIINSCAVKSQTQEKIISFLKNMELKKNQKIIVTGCLPFISKKVLSIVKNSNKNIIGIIDTNSIDKIRDLIGNNTENYGIIILKSKKKINRSNYLPFINQNTNFGIIQISEGCNNNCSYCCTRLSRGRTFSYPIDSIIRNILYHQSFNIKELFLTAQDCGNYNYDIYGLVELLDKIENSFKGSGIHFRIGMINPFYLIKNVNNLMKILKKDLFYSFLHIPIQSASTKILKSMNRGYNSDDLDEIFSRISREKITISTDIICGYPGETIEDFNYTKDFIIKFKPDIINISKFTPRPNTPASKLKQLNSITIKKRTSELSKIYSNYIDIKNKEWIGWEGEVIFTKKDENKKYPLFGRNKFYKPIIMAEGDINRKYKIKIIDLLGSSLIAIII